MLSIISQPHLAAMCSLYAPGVTQIPGLDMERLLWAISGAESSFGKNLNPRHEQSFCYKGKYFEQVRTDMYGCLAHCSYGPLQIMYSNVSLSLEPILLINSPEKAFSAACDYLSGRIKTAAPTTVEQVADMYNSGSFRDSLIPKQYIDQVAYNYHNVPFPTFL